MTIGTFKIEIDEKLTEQELMENCLNLKHSGYNSHLVVLFYALGKRWHIDKLTYYMNLLEASK